MWVSLARWHLRPEAITPARFSARKSGPGEMAVSTEGAVMPAWSHDGKEFFFFSPDDHLASANVESHGDSPVITNVRNLF